MKNWMLLILDLLRLYYILAGIVDMFEYYLQDRTTEITSHTLWIIGMAVVGGWMRLGVPLLGYNMILYNIWGSPGNIPQTRESIGRDMNSVCLQPDCGH